MKTGTKSAKLSSGNWACFALAAAAMVFAGLAPGTAGAQTEGGSKYASATITVATTADGDDSLHFSTKSCSGNLVGAGIFIDFGDGCWAWTMSGIPRSIQARLTPSKISFRHDGKDYVITDPATVKRARDLFTPIEAIQEQQKELGDKQRGLGEKQRALGEQQRDVKVQIPDMNADFKKVEADAKRLSAEGGTQSELGDLQSELGDLQSRLGDLQSQAGDTQSKLGDQQSELGDQQGALGDQQSALGDKAKQMATGIAEKLRGILTQSIQNGTAKAS